MENDHMLLELDHISKIYGDLHAVDDLSLTVPQGQWLAIVGSSGSGKTTLMNMIGCMDTPSKGSVMLEGRRLEDLNARQLADAILWAYQHQKQLKKIGTKGHRLYKSRFSNHQLAKKLEDIINNEILTK